MLEENRETKQEQQELESKRGSGWRGGMLEHGLEARFEWGANT